MLLGIENTTPEEFHATKCKIRIKEDNSPVSFINQTSKIN